MQTIINALVAAGVLGSTFVTAASVTESVSRSLASQVAGSEVAKVLLIETIDLDAEQRREHATLEEFLADLDTAGWDDTVSLEIVDDHTGTAISLEVGSDERSRVCVVIDEHGLPRAEERACATDPEVSAIAEASGTR